MSHKRTDDENEDDTTSKKFKTDNSILYSEDYTLKEERNLFEIFDYVLVFMQNYLKIKEEDIVSAMQDIASSFKKFEYTRIDFEQSHNLCGYFYRYSTFNATLVRKGILGALEDCTDLSNKLKKSEINVVSLGGGPGTDVLGFFSAWNNYASIKNIELKKIVNVTIVDWVKRWSSFYNLIEVFLREGNYGSLTSFFKNNEINSTFLCVDLFSESPPKKYKSDLKKADIVILSRVLDAQNWNEKEPEELIKNIVYWMQENALLLLIDSCSDYYTMNGLKELYRCELNEFQLTFRGPMRFNSYYGNKSKATIIIYEKSA